MIEDTINTIMSNGVLFDSSFVLHGLCYDNNPSSLVLSYPSSDIERRHVVMPQQLQTLSVDRRPFLHSKFERSQEVAVVFESLRPVLGNLIDWDRSGHL